MGEAARKLLEQALMLSEEERGALVAVLQDSIGKTYSQEEVDAAWAVEIERRIADVESGRVRLIPHEDVVREMKARYPGR